MSNQVILRIHQVDPDTVIDIPALNSHMMGNTGLAELYEELQTDPQWKGPFTFDNGNLLMACNWDNWFDGYKKYSMVWGCCYITEFQEFTKFIQAGKVVFYLETNDDDSGYFICTPSKMEKKAQSDLTF